MTATTMSSPNWTPAAIDTALVRINTALACLRLRPSDPIDNSIRQAVEDARKLELYLEANPHAGTADALACCHRLLDEQAA